MSGPLQNEHFENPFFDVRKGPNIGPEPNFDDPTTSNDRDYPEQLNMGRFLTLRVMGSPP